MCGIVAYIGQQNASPLILDGLKRLAYRGYDSAGIAILSEGAFALRRSAGKLSNLANLVANDPVQGTIGIGHTRWATHGGATERNAHPHLSLHGDFVLVHNGIVENYAELRAQLIAQGVTFHSETDSEVIIQLIEQLAHDGLDFVEATRCAVQSLRGAHGIVVMHRQQPDMMLAVRVGNAGGVVIGGGEGEMFVASDIPAIHPYTDAFTFLEDGQLAVITADGFSVQMLDGRPISPQSTHIPYDVAIADKAPYATYMQKEIFEQPDSIRQTLQGRLDRDAFSINLKTMPLDATSAQHLQRIVTVACGTSYYSAQVGKFYFEQLAGIPTEVDYGSEYRYRNPILTRNTALLAITQSGETVDTLSAMATAREKDAQVWSIVNAPGSQAMRLADGYIAMNIGSEISVASTKAFTASVVDQYLLALKLGQLRGTLTTCDLHTHIEALTFLPQLVQRVLDNEHAIEMLASELYTYQNMLYIGRGINYPIALEGALKLKEISYIHAEGYPAGEMKHGPIALLDETMPVLAIVPQGALYEKMLSQVEQARARGAMVIALATEGDKLIAKKADHILYVPDVSPLLSPIVNTIPLQLLAYHIAVLRGANVDQPRNLAKSVTVE